MMHQQPPIPMTHGATTAQQQQQQSSSFGSNQNNNATIYIDTQHEDLVHDSQMDFYGAKLATCSSGTCVCVCVYVRCSKQIIIHIYIYILLSFLL